MTNNNTLSGRGGKREGADRPVLLNSAKKRTIKLTDEENNEFILIGYIGESLEKEEAKYLQASIDQDLFSSLKLQYLVNKDGRYLDINLGIFLSLVDRI